MRSILEWLFGISTLLVLIASVGLVVGVFVGSVMGVSVIVFEALR